MLFRSRRKFSRSSVDSGSQQSDILCKDLEISKRIVGSSNCADSNQVSSLVKFNGLERSSVGCVWDCIMTRICVKIIILCLCLTLRVSGDASLALRFGRDPWGSCSLLCIPGWGSFGYLYFLDVWFRRGLARF